MSESTGKTSSSSFVWGGLSILAVIAVFVVLWEGYKFVWTALEWTEPVDPSDRTLPHTWDIVGALFQPAQRNGPILLFVGALFQPAQRNGPILLFVEVKAAFFTLREALVGFLIGGSIGFWLGVFFVRSQTAERAFMPYVVASQTVPILAIAPMVVVWGGKLDIPQWLTVSIIAAYLTFFPVVINTMRGLRSPQPTTVELMRSYARYPRRCPTSSLL